MNEETLKVVWVIKRARNTPEVERTAEDRIAIGAEKVPKFKEQNQEDQDQRQQQHDDQVVKRFLLLLIRAAVFHADSRRNFQLVDGLLNGSNSRAQVQSFEACGNFNVPLQVFPQNFSLTRQFLNIRKRAKSGSTTRWINEHGVGPLPSSDERLDVGNRTRTV